MHENFLEEETRRGERVYERLSDFFQKNPQINEILILDAEIGGVTTSTYRTEKFLDAMLYDYRGFLVYSREDIKNATQSLVSSELHRV